MIFKHAFINQKLFQNQNSFNYHIFYYLSYYYLSFIILSSFQNYLRFEIFLPGMLYADKP